MNEIFVENAQHYYDLGKKTEFKRNNVKTVYNGTKTLSPVVFKEFKVDYILFSFHYYCQLVKS